MAKLKTYSNISVTNILWFVSGNQLVTIKTRLKDGTHQTYFKGLAKDFEKATQGPANKYLYDELECLRVLEVSAKASFLIIEVM